MPPKRKPRHDEDDFHAIRGGAAVTQNLPSMPSRFDTSYGSAPSTMPRNTQRGQVRNIRDAVQDALNDDDSDDDGARNSKPKSRSTPNPKPPRYMQPDPEPDPEPEPDFGPGNDADSDSPDPLSDPTPEQPKVQSAPRRNPPRTAPKVAPASFPANSPRGAHGLRFLPGAPPPRGSDAAPPGLTPRRASSEGPVSSPAAHNPSRNPGPSRNTGFSLPITGSLFPRALSEEPDRFPQRRFRSEEPSRTPDSTRTFGQESSLFGDAVIGSISTESPSPDSRPIAVIEEEDSPVEVEDHEVVTFQSPTKRPVVRPSRQTTPMAPRLFNQNEPRERVRSPVTQVADGPPPGTRSSYNLFSPLKPEPPRTPNRDQLQPQRQSSHVAPPLPGPRFVSDAVHVSPRHNAFSPEIRTKSPLKVNNVATGLSVVHNHEPQQSPLPGTPSPVRVGPVQRSAATISQSVRNRPIIRQRPQVVPSPPEEVRQNQSPVADVRDNISRHDHDEPARINGSLFDRSMQKRVEEEREKDEAEQRTLRNERKARLQAWPRVYTPIYTCTNTARPDTPPAPADGTQPRRSGRQIPKKQLGWGPWIMFTLADTFTGILSFILSPDVWLIRAAAGIFLVSLLGWTIFSGLSSTPAFGLGGLQWYGFFNMAHNLGQFLPLWITRPSTIFSDEDTREYLRRQRDHEYEITKLIKSTQLYYGSLSKLEQIVPKVVRMELDKKGRPVVSQDFYHALRDLMKSDEEILTLERGHGGYHYISDEHWRAVRDKLKKDPVYQKAANPPAPGVSTAEVENIFQHSFSKSWEKWLRNNNEQVAKILEPAFGTSIPDKIERDLGQKLEKYVKDLYKEKGTKDVVVTREEFIRHLKGEFATHRNEVKAEAQELQKKLKDFVTESIDLASSKAPPAGVSRTEMIHLVDDMIRHAIANAGLEALAKGKISANWNHELSRQVNYLTIRSGTIVDGVRTSPIYEPKIQGAIGSADWKASTRRSPYILSAATTQVRWEDDGECWCGKDTVDTEGKPQGVFLVYQLGHEIIPQHVVVEHILPGATLDPNARPKDMEIWAYVAEVNLRNRVLDFSASHFPSDVPQKVLGDGWVKISQFTYESNDALGGIHVHQLSSELTKLGAATDHIALRAVSNHGADHTCIYRVRVFGKR